MFSQKNYRTWFPNIDLLLLSRVYANYSSRTALPMLIMAFYVMITINCSDDLITKWQSISTQIRASG